MHDKDTIVSTVFNIWMTLSLADSAPLASQVYSHKYNTMFVSFSSTISTTFAVNHTDRVLKHDIGITSWKGSPN